jgi:hypothetical protein
MISSSAKRFVCKPVTASYGKLHKRVELIHNLGLRKRIRSLKYGASGLASSLLQNICVSDTI